MDAAIIDEHIVHLEECIFCSLVRIKAYESIAEGVSCLPISNDVARSDLPKLGEDDLQVLHHSDEMSIALQVLKVSASKFSVSYVQHILMMLHILLMLFVSLRQR